MKQLTKAERSERLSAYLDHELNETQTREVEELAARDPEVRKELEELTSLKSLLASKKSIPPSIGFWTRLSTELDRRKREEENLLPFPRKYLPVVTTLAAVIVVAIGIILFQQRENVVDYVSQQSERVQRAVEDNVLKGSIFPLFSNVDKNQALRFAMFGTIPLDAKEGTELRVDEDSAKWVSINVDKSGLTKTPLVTVQDFVDEVKPTRVQLQIIDSLLDLGRHKLEGSVFVAEDRAMAVHPELSRLNRDMLSGIAATLEPVQRMKFNRFLQSKKAPYTLTGGQKTPPPMDRILHTLRLPQRSDRFVVVTPETVLVEGLQIDIDSLRMHYYQVEHRARSVAVHMDGLIRKIAEREGSLAQVREFPSQKVRVFGDSEAFSIQIGAVWEGQREREPEMWVKPRIPSAGVARRRMPVPSINFTFSGDDTAFNINLNIDSLMMRMEKDAARFGLEFLKNDPQFRTYFYQFGKGQGTRVTDSVVLAKRKQWSKLDSLMREMEKREIQQERQRRDRNVPDERQN
jgi:hypothetical protein